MRKRIGCSKSNSKTRGSDMPQDENDRKWNLLFVQVNGQSGWYEGHSTHHSRKHSFLREAQWAFCRRTQTICPIGSDGVMTSLSMAASIIEVNATVSAKAQSYTCYALPINSFVTS